MHSAFAPIAGLASAILRPTHPMVGTRPASSVNQVRDASQKNTALFQRSFSAVGSDCDPMGRHELSASEPNPIDSDLSSLPRMVT